MASTGPAITLQSSLGRNDQLSVSWRTPGFTYRAREHSLEAVARAPGDPFGRGVLHRDQQEDPLHAQLDRPRGEQPQRLQRDALAPGLGHHGVPELRGPCLAVDHRCHRDAEEAALAVDDGEVLPVRPLLVVPLRQVAAKPGGTGWGSGVNRAISASASIAVNAASCSSPNGTSRIVPIRAA